MPTIYDMQREETYTSTPHLSSTDTTVGYMSAITPRQVIVTRP
ncbi:unnamed protein product, partial [Rotaria sp. Silwood1]